MISSNENLELHLELQAAEGSLASFHTDKLNVYVYESRQQMSAAAAIAVATEIRRLIAAHGKAIGLFTSVSSHNEFLDELVNADGIEWTRVIGFHQAEYLGMEEDAPQSLRRFLLDRLVRRIPMVEFHGIRGEAANPEAVCANYAALLKTRPPDFAAVDIGENGQLSFIDPSASDFDSQVESRSAAVEVVELNKVRRQQQVDDGAFANIEDVPRCAISLTVPTMITCRSLFAIVSGERRQQAVRDAIEGAIAESCPASILRTHPNAHLFLDRECAAKLSRFL